MADKTIKVEIVRPVIVDKYTNAFPANVTLPTISAKSILTSITTPIVEIFSNFTTDVIYTNQDPSFANTGLIAFSDKITRTLDSFNFSVNKSLKDALLINDKMSFNLIKNIINTSNSNSSTTDDISLITTWKRTFEEGYHARYFLQDYLINNEDYFYISKLLIEDFCYFNLNKYLYDNTINSIDLLIKSFTKNILDDLFLSLDNILFQINSFKEDDLFIEDNIYFNYQKEILFDLEPIIEDSSEIIFEKNISNDSFNVNSFNYFIVNKNIEENSVFTDVLTISAEILKLETINSSDNLSKDFIKNILLVDYFREDYLLNNADYISVVDELTTLDRFEIYLSTYFSNPESYFVEPNYISEVSSFYENA